MGCGVRGLELRPSSKNESDAFISKHHRHHKPPQGFKFAIAASLGDDLVGVITVGRPVSRMRQRDPFTLEVTRCCTDGTRNACSFLYAAAARAAFALGYRRIGTYTLPEEGGASLRASGWLEISKTSGGANGWSRKGRERLDNHPLGQKVLWEKTP